MRAIESLFLPFLFFLLLFHSWPLKGKKGEKSAHSRERDALLKIFRSTENPKELPRFSVGRFFPGGCGGCVCVGIEIWSGDKGREIQVGLNGRGDVYGEFFHLSLHVTHIKIRFFLYIAAQPTIQLLPPFNFSDVSPLPPPTTSLRTPAAPLKALTNSSS